MNITPEQHEYLERIKYRIFSNLSAKYFSLSSYEKIPFLPKEIGLLQDLEQIKVDRNLYIKDYPAELADLPKLKHLSLFYNNLKQIPEVFGQLQHVENLNISYNSFSSSNKWELLAQMPALSHLNLAASLQNIGNLPFAICKIKNLTTLDISNNKLKSLPKELAQVPKLEKLYCGTNDFKEFPEVFTLMPNLKELHLPTKLLAGFPDSILCLQHIPTLVFIGKNDKRYPYTVEFERLLRNIKTYNFSPDYQKLILSILRNKSNVSKLNNEKLLSLLNSATNTCIHAALEEIEIRIQNGALKCHRMPQSGDKVLIKGELKGKVSELKKRLEQNNISTCHKITPTTSHILLCAMPGDSIHQLTDAISCITEHQLVNHLNQIEQPYLLTDTENSNLGGIQDLLKSKQTENVLLALEIIKGGGFPMELLTDLFLIYKFTKVQKIKRIIFQIVGQYASLEFLTALKSRRSITTNASTNEETLQNNLTYYCKAGNLDKRKIAHYLLERGRKGQTFALLQLDTKDKKEYFKKLYPQEIASLSNLDLISLPTDFAEVFADFKKIDISYNKFPTVPTQLFDCKNLETIYIRGLFNIQKAHEDLWKIPNLQTIYIGYNHQWPVMLNNKTSFEVNGKTIIRE